MEQGENLCKVETNDGDFYLLIRQKNETGFDLVVTDGCSIWDATVTEDMLQDMAAKVEMNTEDYRRQTFNALTANSSGTDTFIYQAVKKEDTLEFNWKKQLDYGVKFQLGSVTLNSSKENTVSMKKILDFAIKKVYNYKETTANMKYEMEQLARDRESAILRLDKCIVGKEEMEVDLFQKFVTVLNDKKAKIRRLQETIQQQSSEPNPISTARSAPDSIEDNITADKNRDDDTDVEMEDSQNKDTAIKDTAKSASTSNIGSDLFQDEEDTAPVKKRRRKQPSRKPARTPSKPVLPEVKVTPKRTISNSSTNSNNSKQSTGSSTRRSQRNKPSSTFPDDVEDLFGEML